MGDTFDVLVAGGGPAGAATALCLARQGQRVALLEATGYELPRYGETLPPEINLTLHRLGLWDAFQALSPVEAPGMISVWGSALPAEVDFVSNVHGPGWHIDRRRFDQMLLREAAHAGVQVCSRCRVTSCHREDDGWRVGEHRSLFLVDASGKNGLRIDGDLEHEVDDVLLAITLTISCSAQVERDLRTCIEATSSGWWYSAPLPDGLAIAMFFTDPAIYRREGISIYDQLRAAPLTAQRLDGGRIQDSCVLRVASSCRTEVCGNDWLAIGDSASCYDPLSGRGIFKAISHATSAAFAITDSLNGKMDTKVSYAAQVRREFDEYVRQRRFYYASENRWPQQPFWRARTR
jgi:flavin-dependent dehydrogenase